LDQEFQKNIIVRENAARQRRFKAGNIGDEDYDLSANKENSISIDLDENPRAIVKKDFFGRVVRDLPMQPLGESDGNAVRKSKVVAKDDNKVWVTFHEGFSNAVRKPVTLDELMRGL
jgi:chromosome transmission fidelity protein 18